jgi:hypothetical protein
VVLIELELLLRGYCRARSKTDYAPQPGLRVEATTGPATPEASNHKSEKVREMMRILVEVL